MILQDVFQPGRIKIIKQYNDGDQYISLGTILQILYFSSLILHLHFVMLVAPRMFVMFIQYTEQKLPQDKLKY